MADNFTLDEKLRKEAEKKRAEDLKKLAAQIASQDPMYREMNATEDDVMSDISNILKADETTKQKYFADMAKYPQAYGSADPNVIRKNIAELWNPVSEKTVSRFAKQEPPKEWQAPLPFTSANAEALKRQQESQMKDFLTSGGLKQMSESTEAAKAVLGENLNLTKQLFDSQTKIIARKNPDDFVMDPEKRKFEWKETPTYVKAKDELDLLWTNAVNNNNEKAQRVLLKAGYRPGGFSGIYEEKLKNASIPELVAKGLVGIAAPIYGAFGALGEASEMQGAYAGDYDAESVLSKLKQAHIMSRADVKEQSELKKQLRVFDERLQPFRKELPDGKHTHVVPGMEDAVVEYQKAKTQLEAAAAKYGVRRTSQGYEVDKGRQAEFLPFLNRFNAVIKKFDKLFEQQKQLEDALEGFNTIQDRLVELQRGVNPDQINNLGEFLAKYKLSPDFEIEEADVDFLNEDEKNNKATQNSEARSEAKLRQGVATNKVEQLEQELQAIEKKYEFKYKGDKDTGRLQPEDYMSKEDARKYLDTQKALRLQKLNVDLLEDVAEASTNDDATTKVIWKALANRLEGENIPVLGTLVSLLDSQELLRLSNKLKNKEPLSPEEQAVLETVALKSGFLSTQDLEGEKKYIQSTIDGIGDMINYIADFAITRGVMGSTKAGARAIMEQISDAGVKNILQNKLARRLLIKESKDLAEDALIKKGREALVNYAGAAVTPFGAVAQAVVNPAPILNDVVQKMTPTVIKDDFGLRVSPDWEEPNVAEALIDSTISKSLEYWTEYMGATLMKPLRKFSDIFTSGREKVFQPLIRGLEKRYGNTWRAVFSNSIERLTTGPKLMDTVKRVAEYSDLPGEITEEVANAIGDNMLNDRPILSNLGDEDLIAIGLTVGLFGGVSAAYNLPGTIRRLREARPISAHFMQRASNYEKAWYEAHGAPRDYTMELRDGYAVAVKNGVEFKENGEVKQFPLAPQQEVETQEGIEGLQWFKTQNGWVPIGDRKTIPDSKKIEDFLNERYGAQDAAIEIEKLNETEALKGQVERLFNMEYEEARKALNLPPTEDFEEKQNVIEQYRKANAPQEPAIPTAVRTEETEEGPVQETQVQEGRPGLAELAELAEEQGIPIEQLAQGIRGQEQVQPEPAPEVAVENVEEAQKRRDDANLALDFVQIPGGKNVLRPENPFKGEEGRELFKDVIKNPENHSDELVKLANSLIDNPRIGDEIRDMLDLPYDASVHMQATEPEAPEAEPIAEPAKKSKEQILEEYGANVEAEAADTGARALLITPDGVKAVRTFGEKDGEVVTNEGEVDKELVLNIPGTYAGAVLSEMDRRNKIAIDTTMSDADLLADLQSRGVPEAEAVVKEIRFAQRDTRKALEKIKKDHPFLDDKLDKIFFKRGLADQGEIDKEGTIYIDPNALYTKTFGVKRSGRAARTLRHELGHRIFEQYFQEESNAISEAVESLFEGYDKLSPQAQGQAVTKARTMLKGMLGKDMADYLLKNYGPTSGYSLGKREDGKWQRGVLGREVIAELFADTLGEDSRARNTARRMAAILVNVPGFRQWAKAKANKSEYKNLSESAKLRKPLEEAFLSALTVGRVFASAREKRSNLGRQVVENIINGVAFDQELNKLLGRNVESKIQSAFGATNVKENQPGVPTPQPQGEAAVETQPVERRSTEEGEAGELFQEAEGVTEVKENTVLRKGQRVKYNDKVLTVAGVDLKADKVDLDDNGRVFTVNRKSLIKREVNLKDKQVVYRVGTTTKIGKVTEVTKDKTEMQIDGQWIPMSDFVETKTQKEEREKKEAIPKIGDDVTLDGVKFTVTDSELDGTRTKLTLENDQIKTTEYADRIKPKKARSMVGRSVTLEEKGKKVRRKIKRIAESDGVQGYMLDNGQFMSAEEFEQRRTKTKINKTDQKLAELASVLATSGKAQDFVAWSAGRELNTNEQKIAAMQEFSSERGISQEDSQIQISLPIVVFERDFPEKARAIQNTVKVLIENGEKVEAHFKEGTFTNTYAKYYSQKIKSQSLKSKRTLDDFISLGLSRPLAAKALRLYEEENGEKKAEALLSRLSDRSLRDLDRISEKLAPYGFAFLKIQDGKEMQTPFDILYFVDSEGSSHGIPVPDNFNINNPEHEDLLDNSLIESIRENDILIPEDMQMLLDMEDNALLSKRERPWTPFVPTKQEAEDLFTQAREGDRKAIQSLIIAYSSDPNFLEKSGVSLEDYQMLLREITPDQEMLEGQERLNEGVAPENRWTGISNMTAASRFALTEEDVKAFVDDYNDLRDLYVDFRLFATFEIEGGVQLAFPIKDSRHITYGHLYFNLGDGVFSYSHLDTGRSQDFNDILLTSMAEKLNPLMDQMNELNVPTDTVSIRESLNAVLGEGYILRLKDTEFKQAELDRVFRDLTDAFLTYDTQFDFSDLKVLVSTIAEERTHARYYSNNRQIVIDKSYDKSIHHEVGHYVDFKFNDWFSEIIEKKGREKFPELSEFSQGSYSFPENFFKKVRDNSLKEILEFYGNSNLELSVVAKASRFVSGLVASVDNQDPRYLTNPDYYGDIKEIFARFSEYFVARTKDIVRNEGIYKGESFDKFNDDNYLEFVKLLQAFSELRTERELNPPVLKSTREITQPEKLQVVQAIFDDPNRPIKLNAMQEAVLRNSDPSRQERKASLFDPLYKQNPEYVSAMTQKTLPDPLTFNGNLLTFEEKGEQDAEVVGTEKLYPFASRTEGGTSEEYRSIPSDPRVIQRGDRQARPGRDRFSAPIEGISQEQREFVDLAVTSFGKGFPVFLNADGTGVGKTRESLALAEIIKRTANKPVLYVVGSENFADQVLEDEVPAINANAKFIKSPSEITDNSVTYIISYEKLSDFKDIETSLIMLDEAQSIKNENTARSRAASTAISNSDRVLFMTATIGDKAKHFKALIDMLPKTTQTKANEMIAAQERAERLRQQQARLEKAEQTQEVKDQLKTLALEELALREKANEFFENLITSFVDMGAATQRFLSMSDVTLDIVDVPMNAAVERANETYKNTPTDLTVISDMLAYSESNKYDSVVEIAQREIAEGRQVILLMDRALTPVEVFRNTPDVIKEKTLMQKLIANAPKISRKYAIISGGDVYRTSERDRKDDRKSFNRARKDFQEGRINLLISTPESIGTGFNLDDQVGDKPRTIIMATTPKSATLLLQILGRVNRKNTKSKSRAYILSSPTLVEQNMQSILTNKMDLLGLTMGESVDLRTKQGKSYSDIVAERPLASVRNFTPEERIKNGAVLSSIRLPEYEVREGGNYEDGQNLVNRVQDIAGSVWVGNAIGDEFNRGPVKLIDREVTSVEEFATLAQTYRDPRFETMRIFFVKDGRVVGQYGLTQRLPWGTDFFIGKAENEEQRQVLVNEMLDRIREMKSAHNADGYIVLKNHTYGDPTPTKRDFEFAKELSELVPGMLYDVTINTNAYSYYTPEDLQQRYFTRVVEKDFGQSEFAPSIDNDSLGKVVQTVDDALDLAQSVKRPGWLTLFGLSVNPKTGENKIRGIIEVPRDVMDRDTRFIAFVRKFMRDSGSSATFLSGLSEKDLSLAVKAISRGVISDAEVAGELVSSTHPEVSAENLIFDDLTAGKEVLYSKRNYALFRESLKDYQPGNPIYPLLTKSIPEFSKLSEKKQNAAIDEFVGYMREEGYSSIDDLAAAVKKEIPKALGKLSLKNVDVVVEYTPSNLRVVSAYQNGELVAERTVGEGEFIKMFPEAAELEEAHAEKPKGSTDRFEISGVDIEFAEKKEIDATALLNQYNNLGKRFLNNLIEYLADSFIYAGRAVEQAHLDQIAREYTNNRVTYFSDPSLTKKDKKIIRMMSFQKWTKDDIDFYRGEELTHGATADRIEKLFENKHHDPLLEKLKKEKISMEELGLFVMAKYAPIRNFNVAQYNKLHSLKDDGAEVTDEFGYKVVDPKARPSGLTNDEALGIIHKYFPNAKVVLDFNNQPKLWDLGQPNERGKLLEDLAQDVYKMNADMRKYLVSSGLETQETIDQWEKEDPYYVPLRGLESNFDVESAIDLLDEEMETMKASNKHGVKSVSKMQQILDDLSRETNPAGYSDKYKQMPVIGRQSLAANPVLIGFHAFRDAIIRGTKQEFVTRRFMKFVEEHPNDELWLQPNEIQHTPLRDPETGMIYFKAKLADETGPGKKAGGIHVRVDGKRYYIHIKDPRLAETMTMIGRGWGDLNGVVKFVQKYIGGVTNMVKTFATGINPVFPVTNFFRDYQAAMINLKEFDMKAWDQVKMDGYMAKSLPSIFNAVMRETFAGSDYEFKPIKKMVDKITSGAEDKSFIEEFRLLRSLGGLTGFVTQERLEEKYRELQRVTGRLTESAGVKGIKATGKVLHSMVAPIEDLSATMENVTRTAVFSALRKYTNLTDQQAASFAKNVTVNFNRKGRLTPFLNAIIPFFNPNVGGLLRISRGMKNNQMRWAMAKVVGFGLTVAMFNRIVAGRDPDDDEFYWDKLQNKDNHIVIFVPGAIDSRTGGPGAVRIPLPYVYNIGYVMGVQLEKLISKTYLGEEIDPLKSALSLLGSIADAVSPLGKSGDAFQAIMPTGVDLYYAIDKNLAWTGLPVHPNRMDFDYKKNYLTHRNDTASLAKEFSKKLYDTFGWDTYPDDWSYIAEYFFGGAGRFLLDIDKAWETKDLKRAPYFKQFYTEETSGYSYEELFKISTAIKSTNQEYKELFTNKEGRYSIEDQKEGIAKIQNDAEQMFYLRYKPQLNAAEKRFTMRRKLIDAELKKTDPDFDKVAELRLDLLTDQQKFIKQFKTDKETYVKNFRSN